MPKAVESILGTPNSVSAVMEGGSRWSSPIRRGSRKHPLGGWPSPSPESGWAGQLAAGRQREPTRNTISSISASWAVATRMVGVRAQDIVPTRFKPAKDDRVWSRAQAWQGSHAEELSASGSQKLKPTPRPTWARRDERGHPQCPPYSTTPSARRPRNDGKIAGRNVLRIINEPTPPRWPKGGTK